MDYRKIISWISLAAALAGGFVISPPAAGAASVAAAKKKIVVTSTAFKNGGKLPVKYAYSPDVPGGENMSIPLAWTVAKKTAPKIKSFAISIIDLHPVAEKCVHLLVINVPPETRAIEEGALTGYASVPPGTQQLKNCFGELGYLGPDPPPGSGDHTYDITVYGLSVAAFPGINMDNAMDKQYGADEFQKMLRGKVVAKGKLKAKFGL